MRRRKQLASLLKGVLGLIIVAGGTGCATLKRAAVNTAGDALSGGGTTFSGDDDPELIGAALPFSLKLMESLLAQSPEHSGLLMSLGSGFTQYAVGYVKQDADRLAIDSYSESQLQYDRVRKLSLRGRDYMLRALDVRDPGLADDLRKQKLDRLVTMKKEDIPLLYWTAAAWGAAISVSKDNPDLVADIPIVEALIDRAFLLDPDHKNGELHGFLITYETIRAGISDEERARRVTHHFEKAVQLSGGKQAGPYVAFVEARSMQKQDYSEFKEMLGKALAVDPNAVAESRLINHIMQKRAQWLLDSAIQHGWAACSHQRRYTGTARLCRS
jgi:predicted anti-sigma-YlaC factor YlaD